MSVPQRGSVLVWRRIALVKKIEGVMTDQPTRYRVVVLTSLPGQPGNGFESIPAISSLRPASELL